MKGNQRVLAVTLGSSVAERRLIVPVQHPHDDSNVQCEINLPIHGSMKL